MLSIIKYIYDFELKDELWSAALDTLKVIMGNDKLPDLMNLLQELYPEPVEITTINDLLWFDDDLVYEQLGLVTNDKEIGDINSFTR